MKRTTLRIRDAKTYRALVALAASRVPPRSVNDELLAAIARHLESEKAVRP